MVYSTASMLSSRARAYHMSRAYGRSRSQPVILTLTHQIIFKGTYDIKRVQPPELPLNDIPKVHQAPSQEFLV